MAELQKGLEQAANYLQETSKVAKDPAVGGFYLPPAAFDDPKLAATSGVFLSEDGRLRPHGRDRQERSVQPGRLRRNSLEVERAAADGLRGTRLADSGVSTAGIAAFNGDLETFMLDDFALVAAVTLATVFLILLLMLRGVVVAGLLLASVVLSYASAVGLGVLVWQILLDQPLDWWVPVNAFVLLVAVGADYNMLLMKRVREEAPDGSPSGIARAVSATGRVITAAGLIFAASMFAMMFGSITSLAQLGFTVGMGLLLDTFIVRTLVVPACAALLGPRLWWPIAPIARATSTRVWPRRPLPAVAPDLTRCRLGAWPSRSAVSVQARALGGVGSRWCRHVGRVVADAFLTSCWPRPTTSLERVMTDLPLAERSVELVRAWIDPARDVHRRSDPAAERLAHLLQDPAGLDFTVGFVDRVVRPEDSQVAARNLRALARHTPKFLPVPAASAAQARGGGLVPHARSRRPPGAPHAASPRRPPGHRRPAGQARQGHQEAAQAAATASTSTSSARRCSASVRPPAAATAR